MANTVSDTFYLVLSRKERGWGLAARLTARTPKLARNEVAMQLDVEVPRALFDKPVLRAKVGVPASAAVGSVITAEVADNVAELLQAQLGLRIEIAVPEVEP